MIIVVWITGRITCGIKNTTTCIDTHEYVCISEHISITYLYPLEIDARKLYLVQDTIPGTLVLFLPAPHTSIRLDSFLKKQTFVTHPRL